MMLPMWRTAERGVIGNGEIDTEQLDEGADQPFGLPQGEAVHRAQDQSRRERLVRPGLSFQSFHTARRTIAGYEIMAMVRKGQVTAIPANDMPAQATFIAAPFGVAA